MLEPFQNASDDLQKIGKDNYNAMLRSYGELSKGFQAVSARMTEYSKQAFEDATRTFEKLAGVKSLEQAVEIQSQYAKTAFDNWVTEASKLSEMYANMAREAYRPVEKAVAKKTM
jgi:phasin family protein